jgi:hypothetical protein
VAGLRSNVLSSSRSQWLSVDRFEYCYVVDQRGAEQWLGKLEAIRTLSELKRRVLWAARAINREDNPDCSL